MQGNAYPWYNFKFWVTFLHCLLPCKNPEFWPSEWEHLQMWGTNTHQWSQHTFASETGRTKSCYGMSYYVANHITLIYQQYLQQPKSLKNLWECFLVIWNRTAELSSKNVNNDGSGFHKRYNCDDHWENPAWDPSANADGKDVVLIFVIIGIVIIIIIAIIGIIMFKNPKNISKTSLYFYGYQCISTK